MSQFTFEIVLALALTGFVAWAWRKQEPRRPLTAAEVDRYCAIIAERFPLPEAADRDATIERMRGFGHRDDGRDIYMLNLLRNHDRMAAGRDPAGSFTGTPEAANVIYEANAKPILMKSGAFPIFSGRVEEANVVGDDPAEDRWTRVLVVHYPSRRHFFELLTNAQYLTKADFKTYAMHMALVPVKRELVIPDFRFLAAAGAVVAFLLTAWIHALIGGTAL